jgi:hypothetical protein
VSRTITPFQATLAIDERKALNTSFKRDTLRASPSNKGRESLLMRITPFNGSAATVAMANNEP